jgi:hypothetical protein
MGTIIHGRGRRGAHHTLWGHLILHQEARALLRALHGSGAVACRTHIPGHPSHIPIPALVLQAIAAIGPGDAPKAGVAVAASSVPVLRMVLARHGGVAPGWWGWCRL